MTNKSKHTPGPWAADDFEDGGIFVFEKNGDNRTLADLNADRSIGFEQTKANAALIAAAPDLLAALKYCEIVMNAQYHDYHANIGNALIRARAAIAKAKGDK